MKLNPEQRKAVGHFKGVCIVTATPGSGKTRVLTERVIRFVKNRSIPPKNLLCLTFTNKAAAEMKERVSRAIGQASEQIWIGTFHSLCVAILRKYGKFVDLTSSFSIYSDKDQQDLLSKICRMNEYECKSSRIFSLSNIVNTFREDIDDFESHVSPLSDIEKYVLKEYLNTLDEFNAVDFSGLLYKTWILFKRRPDVPKELSKRFQFIMIDEMQDTNTIQYEIVKKIVDPENERKGNLFVVADVAQSIYQWRGAKPENINKIKNDFDSAKEMTLPRNYRSKEEILKSAQKLIRNNPESSSVELISEKGKGGQVFINLHNTPEDESKYVANTIQSLSSQYKYKDFAILYRTNALSKIPEIELRQRNIPYRIIGGFSFFDRTEIKTALSYLSFLVNPKDSISFARAISSPKRQIGEIFVGKLEKLAQKKKISILEACDYVDEINSVNTIAKKNLKKFIEIFKKYSSGKMPINTVVTGLLKESGYYSYIQELSQIDKEHVNRVENLDEFISGLLDFFAHNAKATLNDYLKNVQLLTSTDVQDDKDTVKLLTMHSAKGLEFPVVFIIGAEEKVIPHFMALSENREEEERRLLYVAMTRSKDLLHINSCSYRKKFNRYSGRNVFSPCHPSPFIKEIENEK